jgi:uncharacterized protein
MKNRMNKITEAVIKSPKKFIWLFVAVTMFVVTLVVIPTVSEPAAKYLAPLTIDSDPENMLEQDDPVRVFNKEQKEKFSLYDIIVVGVENKTHQNGVFNKESLKNVYDLVNFSKTIQWEDGKGKTEGVIEVDLITPSTMDNIEQGGPGTVKFEWLMSAPPSSEKEAISIREKAKKLPLLDGTMLSDDGKSIALYIPITSKGISYKVTQMLKEKIASFNDGDEFFISGLPVAQDTFAVEMFLQMATTTPISMMLIFGLLFLFFRNVRLIFSPLIVAMLSVMLTMGLLVITGNSIHIMSSMIPIFIMPIAILDSIHILSEFFDKYPEYKDRKKTIQYVMSELSMPMLFTTLTTAVGFFSLNLTPLPPIQVFGTFVGIGVLIAWLFTITIIPAYIMLMPEHRFEKFGLKGKGNESSFISRKLAALGGSIPKYSKPILAIVSIIFIVAVYGITKVEANDNPIKWFEKNHEIRVADRALNKMFAGTYMAYLSLKNGEETLSYAEEVNYLEQKLKSNQLPPLNKLSNTVRSLSHKVTTKKELINLLAESIDNEIMLSAVEEEEINGINANDRLNELEKAIDFLSQLQTENETFKNPEVLEYISGLQDYLKESGYVGKSSSIVEIVKTVHRELFSGEEKDYRIPENSATVAETFITYEGSHRPHDLWHFLTPDFQEANVWIQLKSGDNKDMTKVENLVASYFQNNPPPKKIEHNWFGLTHINVTWQDQIVNGMVDALMGSFIIVLLMMIFLYRSIKWGLLAMIPLSFSIAVLYGTVGIIGKDLDAPIAVLSALMLGLAVDYAIHFLTRSRQLRHKHNNWADTAKEVFGEPARAITRNVIIIGVGFLPLIISSLIPYKTVGVFISGILVFAGVASLMILPSLIHLFEKTLFKKKVVK